MRYYLKKLSLIVVALDGTLANTWAADSPYISGPDHHRSVPNFTTLRSGSSSSVFSNMSLDLSHSLQSRTTERHSPEIENIVRNLEILNTPTESMIEGANKIMSDFQTNLLVKIKALRSKTDTASLAERKRLEDINDTATSFLSRSAIEKGNSPLSKALTQELHEKAQVGHEKALAKLQHRINPHVPLEIQAIIPQDILNDCNFKDDDTDLQKAQKMAKLGLISFGATDEQLIDLAVTRPEVQFFAAMFFNKAGDYLRQYIISQTREQSSLELKLDHLVSTYQFYNWSYCQLERAGRLHSDVAQSVIEKRDSVAATARHFIRPEMEYLLGKIHA